MSAALNNMADCAGRLSSADSVRRTKLLEELLVARLERKCREAVAVWESVERDWNQTLYIMLARAMGAPRNSAAFERLARRATYQMCLKERGSQRAVEALLLGASGLLFGEYYDDYILALQSDFGYLASKYSLNAMHGGEWTTFGNYPAGNPVFRIAQMAAVVANDRFCFDDTVHCSTAGQVEHILSGNLSEYWHTHFSPSGSSQNVPLGLGRDKINLMAINLVVPLKFAYAAVTGNETLKTESIALLEAIPAERNRKTAPWTGAGVPASCAFDSQALIELYSFCAEGGCNNCPLAKQLKITTFTPLKTKNQILKQ